MGIERLELEDMDENKDYTCKVCPEYKIYIEEGKDVSKCFKGNTQKMVHQDNPACGWLYQQIKRAKENNKNGK